MIAELRMYDCSVRVRSIMSIANTPVCESPPSFVSSAENTGSPSGRGRQAHTMRACSSMSAATWQLPMTP